MLKRDICAYNFLAPSLPHRPKVKMEILFYQVLPISFPKVLPIDLDFICFSYFSNTQQPYVKFIREQPYISV